MGTSVAHYHNLIFAESEVFKPGDFVEETFGVRQRLNIMANGLAAHPKYGTYHCLSFGADGSKATHLPPEWCPFLDARAARRTWFSSRSAQGVLSISRSGEPTPAESETNPRRGHWLCCHRTAPMRGGEKHSVETPQ